MNHAIILAAGKGQRMKSKKDKLLMEVAGKTLIYYTIMAFNDHPSVDSVTIVVNKNNEKEIKDVLKTYAFSKCKYVVQGGQSRQESFKKGLKSIEKNCKNDDLIIVHNGANPLPSYKDIEDSIKVAEESGACIVGHYITSTIKEVNKKHVVKTHDRKKLFAAETPQVGKYQIIKKALQNAEKNHIEATDEAMLFEAIGQKVSYIKADPNNFKITTHSDFERLKVVLGETPQKFRVGIGQDSHLFNEKELGLVLGGVKIPDLPKLKANSDGDVILHAIFNAISQAMGDMSLGFYADDQFAKGVTDSKKYLHPLLEKMKKLRFKINSLGLMIECKMPKIDPLVGKLKKSLSEILDLPPTKIGITATSGENITAFGIGLGIQCFAIVSLKGN